VDARNPLRIGLTVAGQTKPMTVVVVAVIPFPRN